jgi:hypothetical protein
MLLTTNELPAAALNCLLLLLLLAAGCCRQCKNTQDDKALLQMFGTITFQDFQM